MHLLKQSTAATVLVGPVLDSTGAAVTTAAIGDFNLTKNGTTAALAAAATATHSHNGCYLIELTTGNTDTLGRLVISVNNAAQAMATIHYEVLAAATFDALVTNAAGAANGMLLSGANNKALVSTCDTVTSATLAANQDVRNVSGTLPSVTLANGAHGGAAATIVLQTPIAATVPDTQKVDVNTIKTRAVQDVGVGNTAYLGTLAFPTSWPANWSWSTYAGVDTAGTTELLTRIPNANPGAEGGLPVLQAGLKIPATVAAGDGVDSAAIKIVIDNLPPTEVQP